MRVNITYSVGLEDIPKEIDELLSKESETLKDATEILDNLSAASPLEVVENLVALRENLLAVDMRLAECLAILAGYIDVKGQLALPSLSEDTSAEEITDPEVPHAE